MLRYKGQLLQIELQGQIKHIIDFRASLAMLQTEQFKDTSSLPLILIASKINFFLLRLQI